MKAEKELRESVADLVKACHTRKEQVQSLIEYLDERGLFNAPASAQYHCNHRGGLMEHSINVTIMLLALKTSLSTLNQEFNKISDESCVIVGLFHDIHKCSDGFNRPHYVPNVLKSNKISEAKPYIGNKEVMGMPQAMLSALMASQFIKLQEHEIQAIVGHDGQYVAANKEIAHKEHPLTLMLHFADMMCASQLEVEGSWLYRDTSPLPLTGDR